MSVVSADPVSAVVSAKSFAEELFVLGPCRSVFGDLPSASPGAYPHCSHHRSLSATIGYGATSDVTIAGCCDCLSATTAGDAGERRLRSNRWP